MAVTPIPTMSQTELDDCSSEPAEPRRRRRCTAIVAPGTELERPVPVVARWLACARCSRPRATPFTKVGPLDCT
jgi:hypothetical protein